MAAPPAVHEQSPSCARARRTSVGALADHRRRGSPRRPSPPAGAARRHARLPRAAVRTRSTSPATPSSSARWRGYGAGLTPRCCRSAGWGPTLGAGHMDPLDAARATRLIGPRVAIPVHWGTLLPIGLGRRQRAAPRRPGAPVRGARRARSARRRGAHAGARAADEAMRGAARVPREGTSPGACKLDRRLDVLGDPVSQGAS